MKITLLSLFSFLALSLGLAQTPAPIVVSAMPAGASTNAPANSAASAAQLAESTANMTIALRSLEAVKAANEELLKKQAATLQQLAELQKAAEQLKIYSKRG